MEADPAVKPRLDAAYAELAAGRFGEAVRLLQAAAAEYPESAAAQHACGAVIQNLARPDLAEPYLRRALALAPDSVATKVVLSFVLLARGAYAEGWPLYQARAQLPEATARRPALDCPEWRGEPLDGKRLLIWPDEGFGDQIQFFRYAQALRAGGTELVLCCAPPLQALFAANLDAPVVGVAEGMSVPAADMWTWSGFLPGLMGLPPEAAPAPAYITAPDVRRIPGARIGVAARGNPANATDVHRSLPQGQAERLLALPGAISLLPEDTGAADFAETAGIIAGLDLVIAVDTAIAHLAAAQGKPTWILLPIIGLDWRWGLGARTPWHPAARLFRQPRINDWPAVVDAVQAAVIEEKW